MGLLPTILCRTQNRTCDDVHKNVFLGFRTAVIFRELIGACGVHNSLTVVRALPAHYMRSRSLPRLSRAARLSKLPPVSKEIWIRPVGMMGIEPEFEYSRLVAFTCSHVHAFTHHLIPVPRNEQRGTVFVHSSIVQVSVAVGENTNNTGCRVFRKRSTS